ncbi:predicted membrane protein [Moorella thermoacetica Y72]|uniref:Glycerol-3-phosphate acyltransferase n=1 Tax=Moorella thermoacetica Y72 TaxID=1325331 RepID=A0A0S6UJ48_NEOTH|nr:glycerol-3-phosphate acyltransferase [Moorella thermoacetica]GAF26987.1 predicted membrane protein [Moorella thermoacetica Y72]
MLSWAVILTGIFMAYAVGSLAGGHFLSRILYNADVRQVGSGNAGTMNVLRNLGIAAGIMTFIWDTAKGFLVVTLGLKGGGAELGVLMALAAVAGHNWPLYWRFQGGKGLATSLGVALAVYPAAVLPGAAFLGLLTFLTRNTDLATLLTFSALPIYFWWREGPGWYLAFGLGLGAIMLLRHGPLVISHFYNLKERS